VISRSDYCNALVETAAAWSNLEYDVRREAELATLKAPNRFTEEAIVFSVNQQMSLITSLALTDWIPEHAGKTGTVGVLNPGNIPLVGFQDFLAVTLSGHRYVGTVSSKSPFLLPAFVQDVIRRLGSREEHKSDRHFRFEALDTVLSEADALIASGSDETIRIVRDKCLQHGILDANTLLRGNRFSFAVLSGTESSEALDALAEDTLLHEGLGCRNVSVIWAPAELEPDNFLDSMAAFRATFPVHPETAASLKMTKAYLKAIDQPHGFGENLEFLVSNGDPEVQQPGHVRWVEYKNLTEVKAWLSTAVDSLQLLVCSNKTAKIIDPHAELQVVSPGNAQRPNLDWHPDGIDTVDFLARLF
jgi:Acyl-CoA reductase (LuxC)